MYLYVPVLPAINEDDPEVKKETAHCTQLKPPAECLDPTIFDRFSSWFKLRRALALVIKYIKLLRDKIYKNALTQATPLWKSRDGQNKSFWNVYSIAISQTI